MVAWCIHFSTGARVIYTHRMTVAAKESPVSCKNRNCSGAKVGRKPFSLQTPFFHPAVFRVSETHSFSCWYRGYRRVEWCHRDSFFFFFEQCNHFSLFYSSLSLHIQQMMVGHRSGPGKIAVGKIDQMFALVELTCQRRRKTIDR